MLVYSQNGHSGWGMDYTNQEPELHLAFSCGWQGPKHWNHFPLPSQV